MGLVCSQIWVYLGEVRQAETVERLGEGWGALLGEPGCQSASRVNRWGRRRRLDSKTASASEQAQANFSLMMSCPVPAS